MVTPYIDAVRVEARTVEAVRLEPVFVLPCQESLLFGGGCATDAQRHLRQTWHHSATAAARSVSTASGMHTDNAMIVPVERPEDAGSVVGTGRIKFVDCTV